MARLILLYGVWMAAGLIVLGIVTILFVGRKQKYFIPRTVLGWAGTLGGLTLFAIGTFCLAVFVFIDVGGKADALRAMETAHGSPAPPMQFTALDGEPAELADLHGNVVLLNFWATWCAPCLEEMPALDSLQKAYADRGLVVLQISDEEIGRVQSWLADNPMSTTHGVVDPAWRPDGPFGAMSQARPVTFAIDRDGVIRDTAMGRMTHDRFERMVRPLLSPG